MVGADLIEMCPFQKGCFQKSLHRVVALFMSFKSNPAIQQSRPFQKRELMFDPHRVAENTLRSYFVNSWQTLRSSQYGISGVRTCFKSRDDHGLTAAAALVSRAAADKAQPETC